MLKKDEAKRIARQLASTHDIKEIPAILKSDFGIERSLRSVYRWLKEPTSESPNWIEAYRLKHGGKLPLIPKWMLPVVKDETAKRASKDMEVSIPSAQWWKGLLPGQREQVLQLIDWLCSRRKEWWCKSREDYQERIRQLTPGRLSNIRPTWKR